MQAGEHEAAVPCLTEAIELAPERPSYLLHRALAYTGCESPALALRDLEVSLRCAVRCRCANAHRNDATHDTCHPPA